MIYFHDKQYMYIYIMSNIIVNNDNNNNNNNNNNKNDNNDNNKNVLTPLPPTSER